LSENAQQYRSAVAMEMLLHSNGNLQDSTIAFVIDVRTMWEVSMEGSQKLKLSCIVVINIDTKFSNFIRNYHSITVQSHSIKG
jgi:hypothetical protein